MPLPQRVFRLNAALAFAVLLGFASIAGAETPVPVPVPPKPSVTNLLQMFMDAKITKSTDETRAAAKIMAKYWAYGLSHYPADGSLTTPDNKPRPATATSAPEYIGDFMRRWYNLPTNSVLRQEKIPFLIEISNAMEVELKFVFEKETARPDVRLNAIIFFSELCKAPNPALANWCLQIIGEKLQSPAFKLYAFKGLRNLLSQHDPENNERALIEDKKLLQTICKALEGFILDKGQWKDQSLEVVQFIRRGAIEALGAVPFSAVRIRRDEVLARPAITLFKIMTADPSIELPTSQSERLEALIGLLSMRVDQDINLDVLAYGVNRTMLDLISALGEQAGARIAFIPWKSAGLRLGVAFDGWKKNGRVGKEIKNAQQPDYVWELGDFMSQVAAEIEKKGLDARPELASLTLWQQTKKPVNTLLFKDDPTSTFNLVR